MYSSKTKSVIGIVTLIFIILVLAIQNKPSKTKTAIKVGVIAPLTGVVSAYGEQVKKGVESLGTSTDIQFVFEDDQCDAKTAVSVFKKLTEIDNLHYIIGPVCGSPQEAIVPLLKNKDVTVIVPAAASKDLYLSSGKNFYNNQYSLENEAAFLADQIYSRGYKNVAIISYQNEFSKVEHDNFIANFKGKIVDDISYATGVSDIQTELTKIKNGKYDAIFVTDISFYFANGLQKLRNLGIKVPIFSPYPVELPAVRQLVEGVTYSFPANIDDGQGGVFGLSRQSAELFIRVLLSCGDDHPCVKNHLNREGFDQNGVMQRSIVLKQIKNGQPTTVQ